MKTLRLFATLLTVSVMAGDAAASGFLVARFGGEHGNPASDHLTSIYFNPSGLALGRGHRFLAEGVFAYRQAAYERPAEAIDNVGTGTPDEAISGNSGEATLANPAAAPFFGFATDLGVRGLGLGVALYVPFGGGASWDPNQAYAGSETYPGAVDGVQRWATIEGQMRSMYVTAGGAVRFPGPRLSLGVGLNLVRSEISVVRARNPDGGDDMVSGAGGVQEGRSLVDATDTTFSVGAGLSWEASDALLFGASYQSQPGFGEMTLRGTLTNQFGMSTASATPLEVRQSLPDVFRLGVRFRPGRRLELRASGDYVRWSAFERQCLLDATNPDRNCSIDDATGATEADAVGVQTNIERDWHDAFGVRGGASYWLSPSVELMGGAGYDGNAVPDETLEAGLMDFQKVYGTLGARFAFDRGRLQVSAAYTQFVYLERTVAPRAEPLASPSRVPDGAGTYSQSIGVLDVAVQYAF